MGLPRDHNILSSQFFLMSEREKYEKANIKQYP